MQPDRRSVPSRAQLWQALWRAARSRVLAEADDDALHAAVALAVRQGFVLAPAQALRAGVDAPRIRRLVRRGTWRRVSYGVITVLGSHVWDADEIDEAERLRRDHALEAAAAALARPGHLVCERSAGILHGLPVRHMPAQPVATARVQRTLGSNGGVLVRRAWLGPADEGLWFGVPVTTCARTVVDMARNDRRDGVMAADAALREALATRGEMRAVVARCGGWPGIRAARMIVEFADRLAESPLESLVRLALHDAGVPAPELQVEITDPVSRDVCLADFAWRRERLVLEADGRRKYRREDLWVDKQRELAMSRAGYRVERVTWADLGADVWPAFVARLARLLAG